MVTQEERQAMWERVNKATPGPWHFASDDSYQLVNNSGAYVISAEDYGKPGLGFAEYDADFIQHAIVDVPKLLDEVERLRVELEYIQRHRMLVGELAYMKARDALGNVGKSYAEIYGGQDDPTKVFINEHRAARAKEAEPID